MDIYDSLIDCLSNCENLYSAGPGRVKCYGICLDMAERLLKLDIDEKLITINEGERLRNYLNDCRQSLSNVESLKNYCAKKYEELLKAQTAIGAPRKPETEQDLAKKLTECYEDCIKYRSDNLTELQTCYSICDALWSQKALGLDLKPFEKCFPHGVLELEEFMAKYQRVGRFGFEDWQIVSEVSSAIRKMLGEGRQNNCPNLYESILKAVLITLHSLGINRHEIKKAYTHDLSSEEKAILAAIFPNLGLGDTSLIPLANEIEAQLSQTKPSSTQTTSTAQEQQYVQILTSRELPGSSSKQLSLNEALFKAIEKYVRKGYIDDVKELKNTITTLIKLGADVNSKDSKGWTLLHYAVLLNNLEFVKFLIEQGADVNVRDVDGITPLHIAAKNGYFDITKYLVGHGAIINVNDVNGRTPIDYAREHEHKRIAKYLTSHLINKPPIGLLTALIIGGIIGLILLMYPVTYLSSELYLIALQSSSPGYAAAASAIIVISLMAIALLFMAYIKWLTGHYNVIRQKTFITLHKVMDKLGDAIIITGVIEILIIYMLINQSIITTYVIAILIGIAILAGLLLIERTK